jgi:hypothetical protein
MTNAKSSKTSKSEKVVGLSKNDIISIIKHCHKYSVKKLSIEGLDLEFPEGHEVQSVYGKKQVAIDKADFDKAQLAELDNDLDTLMVTDPEAWEQGSKSDVR